MQLYVLETYSWCQGKSHCNLTTVLARSYAMNEVHRLAQLITACWRVSGESTRIPTSHGLLDRALKATTEAGALPEWARKKLHFVDSRIGLQCVEVPDILEWAQRSQLTSAPNPSYETTEVQIGNRVATHLLEQLGITEADGVAWGKRLRKEMQVAEDQLAGIEHSRVEEY